MFGLIDARPDVFNHNLETVPGLYPEVRPGARYFHSLRLLQKVKEIDPAMFTKSGIMVGLGERREEVLQVMDDLRSAGVDFLTIGQYLQPTRKHHPIIRYVTPDEFKAYETIASAKGFLMVSLQPADPLVAPCRRGLRPAARALRGEAVYLRRNSPKASMPTVRTTARRVRTARPRCIRWSPTSSAIRNSCRCARR